MKSINKYQLIALFVIALIPFIGKAQSQDDYFNKAAKQYVNDDIKVPVNYWLRDLKNTRGCQAKCALGKAQK